ncbi:MAG TPA: ABC transporter permease [Terriglobales bacterium]|nr:ABC transporter permease [Terriglobales bacterium]
MSGKLTLIRTTTAKVKSRFLPDLGLGLQNLLLHKLRSLLTMLGMIFGVSAVIAMLSIGAGARQQAMAFIEQLGVRNLIVEAKESTSWEDVQKVRKTSPGLTLADYRAVKTIATNAVESTPRKRFIPAKILPKPQNDLPTVYGVNASYLKIANLHMGAGRFFTEDENERAVPVAVLGEAAKIALFGQDEAVSKYVKVNDQWLQVVGIAGPQLSSGGAIEGVPSQDLNNLIYVPLNTALLRLEDNRSEMRDEIDGIYLQLKDANDSPNTAEIVRGVLNVAHKNAGDFSIMVPAELLSEQKRTQRVFNLVMVAIASISLLVGGIGIMNIMLANILERMREIGVRRALGARRSDIVSQFLIEAVLISFVGGMMGVLLGVSMSKLIAMLAGWSTVTTFASIFLSFIFSVSVGLVFGLYPAMKAAKLDPVEAIRYE